MGSYRAGEWLDVKIQADTRNGSFALFLNGKKLLSTAYNEGKTSPAGRLTFRTGKRYGISDLVEMTPGSDKQAAKPAVFLLDDVSVSPQ